DVALGVDRESMTVMRCASVGGGFDAPSSGGSRARGGSRREPEAPGSAPQPWGRKSRSTEADEQRPHPCRGDQSRRLRRVQHRECCVIGARGIPRRVDVQRGSKHAWPPGTVGERLRNGGGRACAPAPTTSRYATAAVTSVKSSATSMCSSSTWPSPSSTAMTPLARSSSSTARLSVVPYSRRRWLVSASLTSYP